MNHFESTRNDFLISTDQSKLNIDMIHTFLSESAYWAIGRSKQMVESSIKNSLCFGLYEPGGKQIGFTRIVTDRTIFAWICDVFIVEEYRGKGLGKWMVQTVIKHPYLTNIKSLMLASTDAQDFYKKYAGFKALENPKRLMARQGINYLSCITE